MPIQKGPANLGAGSVDSTELASTIDLSAKTVTYRTIVAGDIASDAITNAKIASGVDASKLTTGTLPIARVADAAITNAKLAADGFDASKLTTGTLPIARVADGAVTAAKLASTLDLSSKTLTLPSSSVREYQLVEAGITTNRSLVGDSGWVTHLTVTFTTNQSCTVFCHAGFAHGFEEGIVALHGRFRLDSSATTSELQVFKQGFSSNFSFGAHNLHGFFTSVAAGAHTIDLQLRNYAPGTEARMNNFDNYNAGDRMFVLFK